MGGQGDQMLECDLLLTGPIMIDLRFRCRELCTQHCLSSGKTGHFPHFFLPETYHRLIIVPGFHKSIPKALDMSIIKEKCMVDFTWEELADGWVGIWNQRSSLIAVSQISRVACCSRDSEFTRKDFREDTWRHSLLVLTESEHSLPPPPPWLANKKTRISQSCIYMRWSIPVLRQLASPLELTGNESSILNSPRSEFGKRRYPEAGTELGSQLHSYVEV